MPKPQPALTRLVMVSTVALVAAACEPMGHAVNTTSAGPVRAVSVVVDDPFSVQALPAGGNTVYVSAETFRI